MPAIQFQSIEQLHNKKSLFNLSYEHTTTFDMGQLIPIMIREAVPSDIWRLSMRAILRFAPLVAPVLHAIYMKTFTFFVPYRLLYPKLRDPVELSDIDHNWENFITGGEDGEDDSTLPIWTPTTTPTVGTLWDYFGLPLNGDLPDGSKPNKLALRAYNFIYNEFFRDQNLMEWIDLDDEALKYACWEKDYFTSCLPFQQRGENLAIPLEGLGGVKFDEPDGFLPNQIGIQVISPNNTVYSDGGVMIPNGTIGYPFVSSNPDMGPTQYQWERNRIKSVPVENPYITTSSWLSSSSGSPVPSALFRWGLITNQQFKDYLNLNTIDFSNLGGIDIHVMRNSFQTLKWMERNARCGARYIEQLKARFGENAGDMRLDRPEFIGGTKTPIIISEVLQTAQNPTPVGNQPTSQLGTMAGHGITADESKIGTYRVKEHGFIITLLCVRPETSYSQGIDLQFTRRSRFDYLTPEFVNLSEQAVHNRELYASNDETYNDTIFGFQGRYNEYRYSKNVVSGLMRNDFSFWHLSRLFADNAKPALNQDFVLCKPSKRIFAVPSEPGIFLNYGAINEVIRPLPIIPEPGLIDHH